MISAKQLFTPEDEAYLIRIRREIHEYPELGFELPRTAALVRRELDAMGIPYTERYAPCSVVGVLGAGEKTLALRADMDALPVTEETGLPFSSRVPGQMHACGHDAHTAMLLTAARVLKRAENSLSCRVKLLFQPSEECEVSGAQKMCENGVMDDVDFVIGQHVGTDLATGEIGVHSGPFMAACHPYTVEFFGKSVHATMPQNGHDALAMAVKAYNDIYLMNSRELSPFANRIISVSSLHAGTAHNIITDYAKMLITFRFFDMELHDFVDARIRKICRNAAEELDGTCRFTDAISTYACVNDALLAEKVRQAAEKVVGAQNVKESPARMGSEDFAHFSRCKPGMMFRLGIRNEEKSCTAAGHNSRFTVDEDALKFGCQTFVQTVLDYSE